MKILETEHKRKSAVITAVILMLLLFGIFNFGMKYLDPPTEYGIAINLGTSDVGSGEPVEETQVASSTEEILEEELEEEEETFEEEVSEASEEIQEDVITDDTAEDVPVVEKTTSEKDIVKERTKETPKEVKPKKKKKPSPSKAATDALNSLLNGTSKDGAATGEGDDTESGVKGGKDGDASSNKYYGNSGGGSGGNYNLAGRKALSKPVKQPDCQEEGTIVVSIEVNQNGKVIKVQTGGLKGSTSSAPCLEKAAKEAALKTTWNADGNAPSKQRGTIIYKFSLSQ
ncbi:energy transducer TonB [Tenacibaculum pacificus]|uniref:energy transducer TonB family protein n=1 Tax=Tenacibaculum pacificus TaxID=3018314 RepID=UPI0022F3903C|nr:energy transducer TonB [Tenacibaculum pacificus]WBX74124.1 energy transducer TonB [Tenacibaculum pacificus]